MRTAWLASAFVAACLIGAQARLPAPYDIIIFNGQLIDGSGRHPRRGDVAISAGRIAALGKLTSAQARERIDATGLVVAPGFIDVHTHADRIAAQPHAENFVGMGVTTVVAGNCGTSALDIGDALAEVERKPASINFATLIGHNTVRQAVMGIENRAPTPAEMAKMRSLVWRGMADGAVGFSTGLQYVPGTYARASEIVDLVRIAGASGGVYTTHLRNEGTALEDALDEALRVALATGARIQISHLKVDSPSRWGASEKALAIIDAARARGVDVMADQYAYTAASSNLGIRFPAWALEGGQAAISARLSDPTQWERIKTEIRVLLAQRGLFDLSFAVIAAYGRDPSLNGLSMKQAAARLKGADSADAQFETARDMMVAGGATMVYHLMSEGDIERIMRHPQVAIASDSDVLTGGDGTPHPRGHGNTARVLGEYVRRRKVIRLEEAIRKMTSLPAGHFQLQNRGLLKEGFAADVVILNPAAVRDTATFERPHARPEGISHVLVNGVVVLRKGEHTHSTPGVAIAKSVAVYRAVPPALVSSGLPGRFSARFHSSRAR